MADSACSSDDCTRRRVYFDSTGEGSVFLQGVRNGEPKLLISTMKAYESLAKGCVGYLASVITSTSPELGIHDISVVCEYPDVFPDDLPDVPPHREIELPLIWYWGLVPSQSPLIIWH